MTTTLDDVQASWRAAVDQLLASERASTAAVQAQLDQASADRASLAQALSVANTGLTKAQTDLAAALLEDQQDEARIADLLAQLAALTPFVAGVTESTRDNTGLAAHPGWTPKQTLRGDQTFADGQVIEDADIFGRVNHSGAPILRRCRIRGLPRAALGTDLSKGTALVPGWNASAGQIVLEDCDLVPDESSWLLDGLSGHAWHTKRCRLQYLTDGFNVNPGTAGAALAILDEGSWVGDHAFWTQAGTGQKVHPSDVKTHNDGAQFFGGHGARWVGTTFYSLFAPKGIGRGTDDWTDQRANSCVQWNDNVGPVGANEFDRVRFYGGQSHLNVPISDPTRDLGSVHDSVMHVETSRLGKAALVRMAASPSTALLVKLAWLNNVDGAGKAVSPSRG